MDLIEMRSDSVKKYANDFLSSQQDFCRKMNQLNQKLDEIYTVWSGADAENFVNKMKDKDIAEIRRISEILRYYGEYLRDVTDVYVILDEVYSSKGINF